MSRPESPGVTTSGLRRTPRTQYGRPCAPGRTTGDGDTMEQGDTSKDTAAARLRQLTQYFREHPVTGPVEGHAASRSAPAPLSLATLDHIHASVNEVVEHTHAANPKAGPAPARADAVYTWA